MILLYNVYLDKKTITENNDANLSYSKNQVFYRGNYSQYNNIDIFKYTLASVVNIYPWSKVIINVVLHPELESKKEELFDYITDLFQDFNLILNNSRCERQNDWKELYNSIDDELIFYCCNHDHVFIDYTPIFFQRTIDEFKHTFQNQFASLYFSHWPEVQNLFLNSNPHSNFGYNSDGSYHLLENFAYTMSDCADSVQIITKSTYYKWWFIGEFNNKFLPRPDFFGDYIPSTFLKIQVVPYREYFKHFDGYTHICKHDINLQAKATNISCPLYIPLGFFDKNIRLKIGYDNTDKNYVNINLSKPNYTVIDVNGTDLKCFIDEIPYLWKDKITEIDINPEYNENDFILLRNNSIIDPLTCGIFHNTFSNEVILNKIKETYNIK